MKRYAIGFILGICLTWAATSQTAEDQPETQCGMKGVPEPKSYKQKYLLLQLKSECQQEQIALLQAQVNEVTQQTMQLTLRFNNHVATHSTGP
jgi:hypothetical protein